ncbi:MAG: SLBB domain-containing protein, partial [Pseudomonadota bacterium]|nr:SLBB domain-containing protein [Pseudomonadota bacterium]
QRVAFHHAAILIFSLLLAGPTSALGDATTLIAAQSISKPGASPALSLGVGDAVSVQVYGRPELALTTYVSDDGTLPVPLAGNVQVAGLSPAHAGQRIATAFRAGQYLVNPQVTVLLVQARSQLVSVLGAVRTPGRYAVDSKATVLDVLAQAGGTTENGSDVIVLLRPDKTGKTTRQPIDLRGLSQGDRPPPTLAVHGGDSIFVPAAEQFSIYGEVRSPNMYRLESGMTVVQAIARGGGVTPRGSTSRIEIKRQGANGKTETRDGDLSDAIHAGDVIRIKERLF